MVNEEEESAATLLEFAQIHPASAASTTTQHAVQALGASIKQLRITD